jgi:hypothetical protein
MSSTIACAKSELTDLLDRGSSLSFVLPGKKGVRHFLRQKSGVSHRRTHL